MKTDFFSKSMATLLSVLVGLSVCTVGFTASAETATVDPVSTIVTGENGKSYIEYKGNPYLMYGVQMRMDWQNEDKGTDLDWIKENFDKAAELGFKTVVIPVNWGYIEPTKDNYSFTYLDLLYDFIYERQLNVQWLWFGTDVCGSGANTVPSYVKNDTETYSRKYTSDGVITRAMDFSDTDTMQREQLALSKMMEYINSRDTDKLCVAIQVNNEVDQGAETFDPGVAGNRWYETAVSHDAYCWAGGQREAVFAQLNALGEVVHNSGYNCVTRVNLSGAGRNKISEIADDYSDIMVGGGIDIVGIDAYDSNFDTLSARLNGGATTPVCADSNFTHLAEADATYDSTQNTADFFEQGTGVLLYCLRDDRTGGGMYQADWTDTDNDGIKDLEEFNRQYKEWIPLESTAKVAAFNTVINKAYSQMAATVANGNFASFSSGEQKSFGSLPVTYTGSGLGMVMRISDNQFMFMANDSDAVFSLNSDKIEIVSAQLGAYDNNIFSASADAAVFGMSVTVPSGQSALVTVKSIYTYSAFGEEKSYGIEGFSDTGEVLEDGSHVMQVSSNGGDIVISPSVQDFTVELKYNVLSTAVLNPKNLHISMRGGDYAVGLNYWGSTVEACGDMLFSGKGMTDQRVQYQEIYKGWFTVKITMLGQKVNILLNGKRWNSFDLPEAARSGELKLSFSGAYETKVSGVKAYAATIQDLNSFYNAELTTDTYKGFSALSGSSVNTTTGYTVNGGFINNAQTVGSTASDWNRLYNLGSCKNYTLEYDLRLVGQNWQRGLKMETPAGNGITLTSGHIFSADIGDSVKNGSRDIVNSLSDSQYHKIKLVSKDNFEQLYIDGVLKYENAITPLTEAASLKFRVYDASAASVINIKNFRLYDNANVADRKLNKSIFNGTEKSMLWSGMTYSIGEKDGRQVLTPTAVNNNCNTDVVSYSMGESTLFHMDFYTSAASGTGIATMKFRGFDASQTTSNGFQLVLSEDKCWYYYNTTYEATPSQIVDKVNFTKSIADCWNSLDIYMVGNTVAVLINGEVNYLFDNVNLDAATTLHDWINIDTNRLNNIWYSDISYQSVHYVDEVFTAVETVPFTEGVAEPVTRATALGAVGALAETDREYFTAFDSYNDICYDQGDVNTDGTINVIDLVRLKKVNVGATKTIKSDINKSGDVDATDLILLRKILLNINA